jgi:hypothetical protein
MRDSEANLFRASGSESRIATIQNYQEFLTAVTPHKIVGPDSAEEAIGNFHKDFVTHQVT